MEKKKLKGLLGIFLLFGMVEAGWQILWSVYNNYLPIFLQGGAGKFTKFIGFGLGAMIAGVVMSLDNFLGLVMAPVYGSIGDHAKSRKRLLVISGVVGAGVILLLPVIKQMVPEGNNSIAGAISAFILLVFIVLLIVIAWGMNVSLKTALAYTIVPDDRWEDLNGVVMLVMGIFTVFTMVFLGMFFQETDGYIFAAAFILVANILIAVFIKEPENTTLSKEELGADYSINVFKNFARELKLYGKEEKIGILTVAFMKVLGIFGIMSLQTYASSWIVATFKLPPTMGLLIVAVYFVGYLVSTIPVSKIVKKTGAKKMIRFAFAMEIVCGSACIVIGMFPNPNTVYLLIPFLIALGVCNGIFDVVSITAAVQFCCNKKTIGTTVGVFMTITMLAAVFSVPLCGAFMDLTGWQPVMFALLIVASIGGLFLVRKYKQPERFYTEQNNKPAAETQA